MKIIAITRQSYSMWISGERIRTKTAFRLLERRFHSPLHASSSGIIGRTVQNQNQQQDLKQQRITGEVQQEEHEEQQHEEEQEQQHEEEREQQQREKQAAQRQKIR